MRHILLIGLMALLVLGLVSAASLVLPLPVNGKLVGENVGNQEVRITNLRSEEMMSTMTTSAGEYLVDWANAPGSPKYLTGDTFKVEVVVCSTISTYCTETIKWTGQSELFITFDLDKTIPTPTCPAPPQCGGGGGGGGGYVIQCDEDYCVDKGYCPDEKACPKPTQCKDTVCPSTNCPAQQDCPAQEECPFCPADQQKTNSAWMWIGWIVSLIAVFFGAWFIQRQRYEG